MTIFLIICLFILGTENCVQKLNTNENPIDRNCKDYLSNIMKNYWSSSAACRAWIQRNEQTFVFSSKHSLDEYNKLNICNTGIADCRQYGVFIKPSKFDV